MEPVHIRRRSYSASVPSSARTMRLMRSTSTTLLPACRVILFSAYHSQLLSTISSTVCSPASTGDSRMRL
ncbi:hypothetical protein D3C84_1277430 [compost metagenome]